MLILKALRLDKVTNAMQEYVAVNLGQRFIEPQVNHQESSEPLRHQVAIPLMGKQVGEKDV